MYKAFWTFLVVALSIGPAAQAAGPFMATGFKIGEVTDTNAVVWTRLTTREDRGSADHPMPEVLYANPDTGDLAPREGRPDNQPVVIWPEGYDITTIEGTCPGAPGEVRIWYSMEDTNEWLHTAWAPVDADRDYTRQIPLTDLRPGTNYDLRVETRSPKEDPGEVLAGSFRTAPALDDSANVLFTVSTGQAYPDQDDPGGFKIYPHMRALDPDFFIHTGDIVYYDTLGKTLPLARWHWQRTYSLPNNEVFHRHVASYFIKDDHDTWMNDCWPGRETDFMGDFTFEQGLAVFPEQVPMDGPTHRTFRWGKHLQIWLVEGRDFRSPNTMPDGPDKTIWGAEQKAWFKTTVEESDATFRLLISPTPFVGPDRPRKNDNHSNAGFQHEGRELREFIANQKNMYVVCGDRHWQYVSVAKDFPVREYSCGPASDEHAGGWSQDNRHPEHVYLNVTGGFLSIAIEDGTPPRLIARHYSVDGKLLNEEIQVAE